MSLRVVLRAETSSAGSKLYLVPWSGAVPSAPVLATESTDSIQPYALRYK